MLAQILRDLDLANQVPRLRDTANDLADTTRTLSQWVTQIKAAAQIAAPVFPEHVDIRRKSPFLVRAALIGCLGWLLIGLLIYLHVKGHF
jgi:hypothetical protein